MLRSISWDIGQRLISNASCAIRKNDLFSLRERYQFSSYEELCHRVSRQVTFSNEVKDAMLQRRFCPAGNTLLAGVRPIRPNCSILPTVTDQNLEETITRARRLWRHYTGIGFDLTGCDDPVAVLRQLMDENRWIEFEDRCQRGNMAVVSASHPKAEAFIKAKENKQSADAIYGFNISLAFDNDQLFAKLLEQAEQTKSGLLWSAAVSAWKSGCPGLVFLHRFQASPYEIELDLLSDFAPISTTVPCGEQGMRENESCNLGVINLASRYHHNNDGTISLAELRKTVRTAVQFLDGVVDMLEIDDETMQRRTKQLRRIGLGVTGFADALLTAGFRYNSEEARQYGAKLAQTITDEADATTRYLAIKLGPYMAGAQRRNITVTCCQPTGNITRLLETRGYSIEPLMSEAASIPWKGHLAMQAAWQQHIENAVSKTVNLGNVATVEDVLGIFREAFQNKYTKGVSIYRDGSRKAQPLSLKPGNCLTC